MTYSFSKVLVVLSMILFLSSCSNSKADINSIKKRNIEKYSIWFPLVRADWTLKGITYGKSEVHTLKSGLPVNKVKMSFNKGRVSFYSGCNGHGGIVKLLHKNKLQVDHLVGTQMGCNTILQGGEGEFSHHLNLAESYRIEGTQGNPILILMTKKNIKLRFQGELTPETKYGSPEHFIIELKKWRKTSCLKTPCTQWRKVKFNKNNKGKFYDYRKQWIPVDGTQLWVNNYPLIRSFKPEENRRYILRVKQFKSSDIPSGVLRVNNGSISSERLED